VPNTSRPMCDSQIIYTKALNFQEKKLRKNLVEPEKEDRLKKIL